MSSGHTLPESAAASSLAAMAMVATAELNKPIMMTESIVVPRNTTHENGVPTTTNHPSQHKDDNDNDDDDDEYARFVKSIIHGTNHPLTVPNATSGLTTNNHNASSSLFNSTSTSTSTTTGAFAPKGGAFPNHNNNTAAATTTTAAAAAAAATTVMSPSSSNLSFLLLDNDEDDEEFQLDDEEEEDDEEGGGDHSSNNKIDSTSASQKEDSNAAAIGVDAAVACTPPATTTTASSKSDAVPPPSPHPHSHSHDNEEDDDEDEYDDDDDLLPEFFEPDFYQDLEEELGSLLEEDLEAAVSTLLGHASTTSASATAAAAANNNSNTNSTAAAGVGASATASLSASATAAAAKKKGQANNNNNNNNPSITPKASNQSNKKKNAMQPVSVTSNGSSKIAATPATPGRAAAAAPTIVSRAQQQHLQRLMQQHYQLLLQQAVLAIRTAHHQKNHRHHNSSNNHSNSGHHHHGMKPFPASQGVDWIPTSGGESSDDLAEILDGAVGMLQDLDENRKDAIRNYMQLESTDHASAPYPLHQLQQQQHADRRRHQLHPTGRRSLLPQLTEAAMIHAERNDKEKKEKLNGEVAKASQDDKNKDEEKDDNDDKPLSNATTVQAPPPQQQQQQQQIVQRRLTRAAFKSSLQQQQPLSVRRSSFDIAGLAYLQETFSLLDKCVDGSIPDSFNVLQAKSNADACRLLFQHSRAMIVPGPSCSINNHNYNDSWIPGVRDLSEHFCDPREIFGSDFTPPLTADQLRDVRKNRNLFTSGEDNLVLRGVNLYGEKQWILIADRYLPDRSVNIISQRYSMLCLMLYRAHGIHIDPNGNLEQPPKLESVDDIDDAKVAKLKKVEPPAILNVHRWSLEEDLTLLKAVPLMGHMWAELGARLIPHRDRGHLRKRYQVLERRVKATIARVGKKGSDLKKAPTGKAAAIPTTTTSSSAVSSLSRPPLPLKAKSPQKTASTSSLLKRQSPLKIGTPRQKRRRSNGSEDGTERDAHPYGASPASSSRGAFERLVNETSADWSQMSRVRQLMETDGESVMPDTNAVAAHSTTDAPGPSHLEKEVSDTLSRLPQMDMDGASNGLSMFNSATTNPLPDSSHPHDDAQGSSPPAPDDVSILASVLQRTKKVGETSKAGSNKAASSKEDSPSSSTERLTQVANPTTPSRRPTIFSADGTPIGLSPAFRPGIMSPYVEGSASKGGFLSPNTPRVCFSPEANSMLNHPLHDGDSAAMYYPEGTEESSDGFPFSNFVISDHSRQALEGTDDPNRRQHRQQTPNAHSRISFTTPSKGGGTNLFGEGLMENDLVAISALNSLSSSPALAPPRMPVDDDVDDEDDEDDPTAGDGPKYPSNMKRQREVSSKSFFAKVLGGIQDKKENKKKRRLEF